MSARTLESAPGGRRSWRRAWPQRPLSVVLSVVVLVVAGVAALLPWLVPLDTDQITARDALLGPSGEHLLGTDQLGRDVLSRLVAGARSALLGPTVLAAATVVLSTALALVAGFHRGWVDALISRLVDLLYSVPAVVVAIVVVGVLGGGYWTAIAVLLVFGLPQNIRVLRAAVLERVELPYVEAAQALGVPSTTIMVRHLLPGIGPVVVAAFFLQFTYGIVDLSSLSFLGLGVPPGSADWGRMLAENRAALAQNIWAAAAPGAALVAVAVATNLLGDWVFARFEAKGRSR